ncbi:MAG TPA: PAS domain S-box protein, partial [Rhizomicrobium sp.]|nr:PAS domain S-box protein [Rhizomicrobium sp.]
EGYLALDSEWRITYLNTAAERLIGMRRGALLAPDYRDLLARVPLPAAFEHQDSGSDRCFQIKAYPAPGGAISLFIEDITTRNQARRQAESLNDLALAISGELELEKIAHAVTGAATALTQAEFGAFCDFPKAHLEPRIVYALPGDSREDLQNLAVQFAPAFREKRIVRGNEIRGLPVLSYLAVPVVSRNGEVLGGLLLAHSGANVFTEASERLATTIAGFAAGAIDNSRLFARAEQEIANRRRAEELLRESENRFRQMIDALPAAIYTTDAHGYLTHFNPAAVELSGRVPELGSDRWCVTLRLYNADGTPLPHEQCPMAAALKEQSVAPGQECIAERPDGSRFWFTPYPTPLRDKERRIVGAINMLVDITARKQAEEALRRSQERFRGVFESSAIGVAVLTLEHRIVEANSAFCTISGYSETELDGLDSTCLIHPGDVARARDLSARLISGAIPSFTVEQRCLTKDSRAIWVCNSFSLMRDAAGRPEYLIALCEDITLRKRIEADLRESEERSRAIVETTPECVKVVARDGTLLQMNGAGLAMVSAARAENVVGQSVFSLIAPEFRDRYRAFHESVCGGRRGSMEFDIVGLSGERRRMESHAAPLRKPDGTTVNLSISRDVTDRKRKDRVTLLLGAIVNSSHDAIVSKDLNGVITSWNQSAERLFGYTAEEAIGQPVTMLIPLDRQEEEPLILERLRGGETIDHFETIRRRKDGTLFHVSLTISPVRDEAGTVIGASKIAR